MINPFIKIINKKYPSYKVAENKYHLAFLDISPLKLGHTLVIPKKQYKNFTNMKDIEFLLLMRFVYLLSKSIEKTIICNRIGISIVGFQVPHVHVHIVPITKESDMNFSNCRLQYSHKIMQIISNTIKYYYIQKYK